MFARTLSLVLSAALIAAKEPTIDYRGKTITHARFQKIAKKLTAKQVNELGRLLGLAGQVEGVIAELDGNTWTLAVRDPKGAATCEIDASRVKGKQFKEKLTVHVWGILTEDGLKAEIVELVPPGIEWAYMLRDPGPVRGGQRQVYSVDCVVQNGEQHLSRVLVAVRLY